MMKEQYNMSTGRILTTAVTTMFVLIGGTGCGQHAVPSDRGRVDSLAVKSRVAYLSSDEMKGRANGSPEMKRAAEWIAEQFARFGLQPPPGEDGYFQEYSFTNRRTGGEIQERNVIGYLEGNDPELKDEYIVISAHFDHIGIGPAVAGDSVYNGADDNATGTTGVITLAELLSAKKKALGRSLVFIAFSGEELGLQGSRYYVSHPLFPLEKTRLNINLEMLGHSAGFGRRRYLLTGPSYSTFDELVRQYNQGREWAMVDTFAMSDRLFRASDNAAFAYAERRDTLFYGVPAHTFAITDDGDHIHRPHDEAASIDYENMASFLTYLGGFIEELSRGSAPITWTDDRFRPYRGKGE
ncbi:M28 family peptidase [bacterium]|nr:M28 family peptidase [bacterium]